MKSSSEKLIKKHPQLTQTDHAKVVSHAQRPQGDWIVNTIMIEGCDVPFRYRRREQYKNLKGQRVNLTYYPDTEIIGGMPFECMRLVRVKIA